MRDQRVRLPGKHARVHVVGTLQRVEPRTQLRLMGRDLCSSTEGGKPGTDNRGARVSVCRSNEGLQHPHQRPAQPHPDGRRRCGQRVQW